MKQSRVAAFRLRRDARRTRLAIRRSLAEILAYADGADRRLAGMRAFHRWTLFAVRDCRRRTGVRPQCVWSGPVAGCTAAHASTRWVPNVCGAPVLLSVTEGATIYVLLSLMPSKHRKAVGCVHPHGLSGQIVAGKYRSDYLGEQHHR